MVSKFQAQKGCVVQRNDTPFFCFAFSAQLPRLGPRSGCLFSIRIAQHKTNASWEMDNWSKISFAVEKAPRFSRVNSKLHPSASTIEMAASAQTSDEGFNDWTEYARTITKRMLTFAHPFGAVGGAELVPWNVSRMALVIGNECLENKHRKHIALSKMWELCKI